VRTFKYIYMFMYIYICICIIHIHSHVDTPIKNARVFTPACTHTMYVQMHVHIKMNVLVHMKINVHVQMKINVHVHMHIHAYTMHVQMRVHIQRICMYMYNALSVDRSYRVAKTHRIHYLYRSFSAKETYI